jgi:hypothetical protein
MMIVAMMAYDDGHGDLAMMWAVMLVTMMMRAMAMITAITNELIMIMVIAAMMV